MFRIPVFLLLAFLLAACVESESTRSLSETPQRGLGRVTPGNAVVSGAQVALVIGNDRYEYSPLQNPVRDAGKVAQALRARGFEVTLETNLGFGEMRQSIERFQQRLAETHGTGLLYFAGHGVEVLGRNYLLPVNNGQIRDNVAVQNLSLSLDEIQQRMDEAQTALNIVILDACRDNPFPSVASRTLSRGLKRATAAQGTLIAYATNPQNTASDAGFYADALAQAIQAPGLKLEDVFKQVHQMVATSSNGGQKPWYNASFNGDFCFGGCGRLVDDDQVEGLKAQLAAREAEIERLRREKQEVALNLGGQGAPAQPSTASPPRTGSASGQEITVSGRTYIAYADGTALDTATGLMWMRCSLGQTWNGSTCAGEAKKFNWEDAKKQTANFAGYSDWRLPTIEELRPLRYCSSGKPEYFMTSENLSRCEGDYQRPTIAQAVFPNTPEWFVWSSSANAYYSSYAWGVYFNYGNDGYGTRDYFSHVRLVRGGQ